MTVLDLPRPRAADGSGTAVRHRRLARPERPAAALVLLGLVAVVLVAPRLDVPPAVHDVALFLHLAALVLGLGAVLTADVAGLGWMLRRRSLASLLEVTEAVHTPIWLGLGGLVATGALLSPDPSAPLTALKLILVAALTVNGARAGALGRRLRAADPSPQLRLLLAGAATAGVSQACWWGATVIGYLNAR